jgi:hypothetical protein
MDSSDYMFLFYYYWELWRRARDRERLAAELATETSGVFKRPLDPPLAPCEANDDDAEPADQPETSKRRALPK